MLRQFHINIVLCSLFLGSVFSLKADVSPNLINGKILESPKSPHEGIERLMAGNQRYAQDKSTCPDRNEERRLSLLSKQAPFAVILGCSDSRVSPEIVFDQGSGDLFVVRNAGNVITPVTIDTIEYGVHHLKASVILVLGHENCGAVTAVVEGVAQDIPSVVALIHPVVVASKSQPGNAVENAIKANVQKSVKELKAFDAFKRLIDQNQLIIVGGYFDIHTGIVEILK